jgi:hypothetical protein
METFKKQQHGELSDKKGTEIISKHCEGKACLCHGIPRSLYQMLHTMKEMEDIFLLMSFSWLYAY